MIDLKQQSRCDSLCSRGALGQAIPESPKNSQQFILLILGLNLPFFHCHCAALQIIPPPSGNQEQLPPGACVPQILAVTAACKETLLRKEPLLLAHSLLGAPCQWRRAGAINLFKWPCPKDSYCLYCNCLCHPGTGNRAGAAWASEVDCKSVDLNLFCLLKCMSSEIILTCYICCLAPGFWYTSAWKAWLMWNPAGVFSFHTLWPLVSHSCILKIMRAKIHVKCCCC